VLHRRARRSTARAARPDLFRRLDLTGDRPGVPGLHRALRLVIAAGTAAAGVCLVLGMTALVVKMGGGVSGSADSWPVTARQASNLTVGDGPARPAGPPNAPPHWIAGQVVAYFRGARLAKHAEFRIVGRGTWGLSWSFRCVAGRSGRLVVTGIAKLTGYDLEIDASGPAGHGITWYTADPGNHSLDIISACSWAVRVVLPRRPSHRPAPG